MYSSSAIRISLVTVIRCAAVVVSATSTTVDVIDIDNQDTSADETDIARKDMTACSGPVEQPSQKEH